MLKISNYISHEISIKKSQKQKVLRILRFVSIPSLIKFYVLREKFDKKSSRFTYVRRNLSSPGVLHPRLAVQERISLPTHPENWT